MNEWMNGQINEWMNINKISYWFAIDDDDYHTSDWMFANNTKGKKTHMHTDCLRTQCKKWARVEVLH